MADVSTPAPGKRPWYSPIALLQRVGIYIGVSYVTLCVLLFFSQNSQEYPRYQSGAVLDTAEASRQASIAGLIAWDHPTPGAKSPQGYIRPDFGAPAKRGTIVVFHGNGGWALDRGHLVDAFLRRGFRTFLYEYPGYGGRPGRPNEFGIVPDARALIRLLDDSGYGPIYVWGESLGSGVSAAVCADPSLPVHGLALLTPWDNVANVGLYRFPFMPVRLLMTDRYDSIANLENFRHPICVVRGSIDPIIPPALTLNLFAHLPHPKKIILEEGYGHGDWPTDPALPWWDDVLNFIAPVK